MDHRQNDPAFGRDEGGARRQPNRNQRWQQPSREFQPGNYGFEEGLYGSGQYGEEGPYGYGGSGGSTYGAGGYEPYSGESGRLGRRERWGEQRDYYGQGQRWDEQRGSDYSRSGYDPQRWGERERWADRDRWSDRDRFDEPRSGYGRWREPQRDYYGQVQRGGSFFGDNRDERPGERGGLLRRIFKRGPKGYQRTDERLREDISERLMYASYIDSSEVTVAVAGGKVTLEGTVPDRYMKHAIEDLVDECPGIQDIDNRVRVQSQREDLSQDVSTTGSRQTRAEGSSASGSSANRRS